MAPATGDDAPDSDRASEAASRPPVAAALDEFDDGLAESVASSLTGRSDVVAVGVPLALLPAILAARDETTGGTWRVACRPGAVEPLARALVLGTAVAEAVATGSLELRTAADLGPRSGALGGARTCFASADRVDAVAGPASARTLVTEETAERVAAAGRAVRDRFASATPATVGMPARSRLLATAAETLDDRFATDLAAALDALPYGALGRSGDLTDRTLLVALAARHDHLLWDLRRWISGETQPAGGAREGGDGTRREAERVGVAAGQDLTDDRRRLVRRGLIEAIKVPVGDGRPRLRLRAVDDALLRATPTEVLSVLRGRFALPVDEDGRIESPPGSDGRRPVWERTRRGKN